MGHRIRTKLAAVGLAVAASAALATGATPAAASSAVAAADSYCQASFYIASQWSGGYVFNITVSNVSSTPVRWRLVVVFSGPVLSIQVWNAQYTQSGSVGIIIPVPPNDVLQPGQSVTVGAAVTTGGGTVTPPQLQVTCTPV